ncbi:MAG: hypothetical protein IKL92_05050 [Oscillospiraceae bacterium]|nr:hypothetical protein [Oscillospiraceae bacterium]
MDDNKFLSGTMLKLIACTAMAVGHFGAVAYPGSDAFVVISRLAFPIFAFLLVEGAEHTRDIQKYILRMGLFAIISELPYDFALHGGLDWTRQNVFVTFFFGLVMIMFMEMFPKRHLVIFLVTAVLNMVLSGDYHVFGIFLIWQLWTTKKLGRDPLLAIARYALAYPVVGLIDGIVASDFSSMYGMLIEMTGIFAALPLMAFKPYNVENRPSALEKWAFYAFYPLHLLVIAIAM